MISFLEKFWGFVEGFALRFVQDSHQIFFLNSGSGIAKDSVIFANDLGWIRIPKKDSDSSPIDTNTNLHFSTRTRSEQVQAGLYNWSSTEVNFKPKVTVLHEIHTIILHIFENVYKIEWNYFSQFYVHFKVLWSWILR